MRLPVNRFLPLAALVLVSACFGGGTPPQSAAPLSRTGPSGDYPMVLGEPFAVDGITYTPVDTMNYDAVGHALVGSEGGEAITAAHRTMPLPSYVEVTALETGKTALVRIERRGPMTGKALIDLSPGAANQLGLSGSANAAIRVRRVNPPEQERALLRAGQNAPLRMDTPKSLLVVLQRKLDAQDGVVSPAAVPALPVAISLPAAAAQAQAATAPLPKAQPTLTPKARTGAKPAVQTSAALAGVVKDTPTDAPATSPAPQATGAFRVRIGAYGIKANADAAVRKSGGSAMQQGALWIVSTGPFVTDAEAHSALAKAKAAGYSDARIQRAN